MPNQKGSIKDRIRARFRFLQYKMAKRKKAKEILKCKKKLEDERKKAEQIRLYGKSYNKFQVFGLTVLGLLVGLITPKSSSEKVVSELEIIEKSMKQIILKLEQDKKIENIYNDIDNTYQKLEDIKIKYKNRLLVNSFQPGVKQPLLETIVKKEKELEVLNEMCHTKEKQNILKENILIERHESSKEIKKSESLKTVNTQEEILKIVKKTNETLKDYDKELELLKKKVDEETSYKALFDYEFKLKQLKMRIEKILEEYEILKEKVSLDFLEDIIDIDVMDKYELRKDEKKIVSKIIECKKLLENIEEKKNLLSAKKEEQKNTSDSIESNKKEEVEQGRREKENQKEKEKKKIEEKFDEIYLANKMIVDHILKEKKAVDKLKRQLYYQQPLTRKRSMFFYARRITSSILNFGISLLPFRYFKNRLMGSLVSGIMINNSLRSVRRVFSSTNQEVSYLYYQNLAVQIKTNQDYIHHITDVCLDSLWQIREIRNYLNIHYSMLREYDLELSGFNQELDELENQLSFQVNDLEKMNENYDNIKQKIHMKNGYHNRY